MATIVIIGAGMMGSAMAVPASDRGHEVRIVGTPLDGEIIAALRKTGAHPRMRRTLPEGIAYYRIEELDTALPGADLIICGVSSFGVTWFAQHVLPRLSGEAPVLSVTKGLELLEDGTLRTFPQALAETQPPGTPLSFNAIGGPCTSYELADRHHSEVAFCGEDPGILRQLKEWLQTEYYHISLSTDVTGVEVAVALKNAYALGVTLAIGLAERAEGIGCVEHYNSEAALFGQSVREMSRLLALLGGGAENIIYGAGDLYVTVFGGRTRLLGTLLGRGLTFEAAMRELDGITLESVAITRRIGEAIERKAARGEASLTDYPLLMHVYDILTRGAQVNIPWKAFETSI